MLRIYLDTNVFSNLKAAKNEKYQQLSNLIEAHKAKLSFYFSNAHIRDKRKDLTDHKYEDLQFMEGIVYDNYLAYDPISLRTGFYLATPTMAFNDSNGTEVADLQHLFEIQEKDDETVKLGKNLIKTLLSSIPIDYSFDLDSKLPENHLTLLEALLPSFSKPKINVYDLVLGKVAYFEKLSQEVKLYKDLRQIIIDNVAKEGIKLNGDLNFNEALKHTSIQKTFLEFVKDSMPLKRDVEKYFYEYYQCAYSMLDAFGISKEKLSSKNTFINLQIDAEHSYFAQFCDLFITEDKVTRAKSQALYDLFQINTEIFAVEEFIEVLTNLFETDLPKETLTSFFEKLTFDIQNSECSEPFNIEEKTAIRLIQTNRYLDVFDSVVSVLDQAKPQLLIFKAVTNDLFYPSYSEQSKIISLAIQLFGKDKNDKGAFDYSVEDSRNQHAVERIWHINDIEIRLGYSGIVKTFCLQLTFDTT